MSGYENSVNTIQNSLTLIALDNFPLIKTGDDIANIILQKIYANKLQLEDNDILIIAQKIISKSEGRKVFLEDIKPSRKAIKLANETNKDPRIVELILNESSKIVRVGHGVIIAKHLSGFVMANAGIDQSNVNENENKAYALLLPIDSDHSANCIKECIEKETQKRIGVIINDSIGRAWRVGIVGHALGVAGLSPIHDLRGRPDLFRCKLNITQVAIADELSAAASILMGQASEGKPVVLIRGLIINNDATGNARALLRPESEDLFL